MLVKGIVMMKLYSNATSPFSHRCRIMLYEKGMGYQIINVDLHNNLEAMSALVGDEA